MRTLYFKDKKISQADFDKVISGYEAFLTSCGIKNVTHWTEEMDYSDYPVEPDTDFDSRPAKSWVTSITDGVYKKYNDFGVDHVVLLVHLDNWKSAGDTYKAWLKANGQITSLNGIWGLNQSYTYRTYQVQYVRWDNKNPINTFGTLNHEQDHSYDALCSVETSVDIAKILGVSNYDKHTTHGGRYGDEAIALHGYIKYQENSDKLKKIAPYLNAAYAKRKAKHDARLGQMNTIVSLAQKVIYLFKAKLGKKDGVTDYL